MIHLCPNCKATYESDGLRDYVCKQLYDQTIEFKDAALAEKDVEITRMRTALESTKEYAKMIGNQAIVFVVSKALEK